MKEVITSNNLSTLKIQMSRLLENLFQNLCMGTPKVYIKPVNKVYELQYNTPSLSSKDKEKTRSKSGGSLEK